MSRYVETGSQKMNARNERLLPALFLVGVALGPVYFLPSGLPQVGDWILAVWALLTLVTRIPVAFRTLKCAPTQLAVVLVAYITVVSVAWAVNLNEINVAFQALFYIFNLLVVWALVASVWSAEEHWRTVLRNALVLATAVLLVMFLLRFDPGRIRQTAGFNNPNQLGYYALLLFCTAFVVFGRRGWNSGRFWFVIGVAGLMIPFSASLAAAAGFAVAVLGALLIMGWRHVVRFLPMAFLVALVLGGALVSTGLHNQLISQVQARIAVADRKVDNLIDDRGYSRIVEYPEYVLFGAGEGARYRFGPQHSHELHSTLGTLLFSYGIPGLATFLAMLWYVARRKTLGVWMLVAAPLVYSFSHQGLRTTFFWVLLFIVWIYGEERKKATRKVASPGRGSHQPVASQPELVR